MATYRNDILEFNAVHIKIKKFKRDYLRNQFWQHMLIWFPSVVSIFFVLVAAEHFFYLSPQFKIVLESLFFFLIIFSLFFIFWFRFSEHIGFKKSFSEETLSSMLSSKFVEIEDRLLSLFSLVKLTKTSIYSEDLIVGGIIERSDFLSKIPFNKAIDQRNTYRLFYYFVLFHALFSLFFIWKYADINKAFERLSHPTVFYSTPAPFQFILQNSNLRVEGGKDLSILLHIDGNSVPSQASILFNSQIFEMTTDSSNYYSYNLYNLKSNFSFQFEASGFYSPVYNVKVLHVPSFTNIGASFIVPSYTGDSSIYLSQLMDVDVPEGTVMNWFIKTSHADSIVLLEDLKHRPFKMNSDEFHFEKTLYKSVSYSLSLSNINFIERNKLDFRVNVIPDKYPQIEVINYVDSISIFSHYFYGNILDDYGFTALQFKYRKPHGKWKVLTLPLNKSLLNQQFYYSFDFSTLKDLKEIEYLFTVFDNDAIHGAKSSSTQVYRFKVPSKEEIENIQEQSSNELKNSSSSADELMEDIKKNIKDLYKTNSTENLSDWERTQKLKDIEKQRAKLEKLVSEIKKKLENKNELESFLEKSDEIKKKQEELQKLFEELFDDELKDLFKQLQELEEKFDDKKFDHLQEQLDNKLEDLQKELDRNLELLKRYEIERDIEQSSKEFDQISQSQKTLKDSLNLGMRDSSVQKDIVQKLENKEKRAEERYEKLLEKNRELKEPMKLDDFKKEFSQIDSNFQEQKQKQSKRSLKNKMEENERNLKDLSQKMSNMMKENESMQLQLSIEDLRQILDNIVEFSFKQEDIMKKLKSISLDNPLFIDYLQEQKNLERDFLIIRDSLNSISEQVPQIASLVKEEIDKVRKYTSESVQYFEQRRMNEGSTAQQYVMTSANNLALFIDESLQKLKEMQKNAKSSGKGKKNSKSGAKPGFMQLKEQQNSLKQQMQQMVNDMKNGKLKKGDKSYSKRLAEMLAQQEIMQRLLEEMSLNGDFSQKTQKMLQEIKNLLNKNEIDIVNKNISPEILNRQQKILTRLLQAENSENKREKENKRESKSAKNLNKKVEDFDWDKFNKTLFKQNIHGNPLNLQPFYKQLFDKYIELDKK